MNKSDVINKIVNKVSKDIDVDDYAEQTGVILKKAFKEVSFSKDKSFKDSTASIMDLIIVFYESPDDFVGGSRADYISSNAISILAENKINIVKVSDKLKERLKKNIYKYAINKDREIKRLNNI